MRRILLPMCLAALCAVAVGAAVAQEPPVKATAAKTKPSPKTLSVPKRLPPLQLPNTKVLEKALLRAERPSVQRQLVKSRQVVAFWKNRDHRWLLAPNKTKCWEVPWQRSCTAARASFRLHLALATTAQRKLDTELPLPNDWVTAVRIIQRVFPGTESWLLSCSAAESSHGRWVRYGGGSYYPGFEHEYVVGGWMQYKWPTFKGHYRNGLEALRQRGFEIDMPDPSDVKAWLMPIGQAIAAGWARWSGNDNGHWEASWGNGC